MTHNQTMSNANYTSQRFLTLEEIGIDKVLVINRDIRKDRLAHVSKLLGYLKLPFTRFPAIDAGKFFQQMDRFDPRTKFVQNISTITNTNGQTATWQSHLQVYFTVINAVSANDRPVLIFEDDFDLEVNASYLLKEALSSLPNDWEIFFLDHSNMQCKRVYPNNICRAHTFFCADAYIIRNSTVARKLINWSNTETPQVADVFWHPYISNDALIAYAAYPNHIAMQDRSKFGSDVLQSGPIKVVNLQNPLSKILQA
ncbi:unnamed protein product [Rotaria sp. Silwood1]|nr:unnamed protein product [Rotaria sp. Silwood1]